MRLLTFEISNTTGYGERGGGGGARL